MDIKEIVSLIGMFIIGGLLGVLLGVVIVVHRLKKYGLFHFDGKTYKIKGETK